MLSQVHREGPVMVPWFQLAHASSPAVSTLACRLSERSARAQRRGDAFPFRYERIKEASRPPGSRAAH